MENREPEVIRDNETMRRWSKGVRSQEKTIGLVRPSFHRRSRQARALPSSVSDVIVVFNPRNLYDYDGGMKKANGGGGGVGKKTNNGGGGGGGKKTNNGGGRRNKINGGGGVGGKKTNGSGGCGGGGKKTNGSGGGGGKVVSCVEESGFRA
ncbi:unnamed protein product [Brassica oleracea]